jgi:hypothetical protein
MAHVFAKPNRIINTAVQMLQDELVLPGTVWLNGFGTDFSGLYNDTITLRIEQPTTADRFALRAQGADRTLNKKSLTETTIDVKLDTNIYSAVDIQDEEYTLDIEVFASKVLARQVRAVAADIEYDLSNLIKTAPYTQVHGAAEDGLYDAFVDADTQLNEARIPRAGRTLIVGSRVYAALRKDDRFIRADSAGDQFASAALRDAMITRIGGMNVFLVDTIPNGSAFLYHPTAFAMVSRAPKNPISNVAHASYGVNGLAARWLADYSPEDWSDVSVLNTYTGYKAIIDPEYTDVFGTKGNGFVRGARVQLTATDATITNTGTVTAGAGANHTRQLKLIDSNGDDRTWEATWASSDASKATVGDGDPDAAGLVTGVAAGSTNITAVVDGHTETWALTVAS